MKYSIIIVAYKAFEYLDNCLASLSRTREDWDAEVIVVDNTPGQRTLDEIKVTDTADQVYRDGQNHGFAEGCNIGARLAKGEILVFLNPDTEVHCDRWLEQMEAHLGEGIGAVGPISNYVAGMQRADLHLQPMDTPAETAALAAEALAGRGIVSKVLIGFCLMMRRAVWDEMGGMDPKCFLGSDDLDLSWRLQLAGYELVIATDVFVYHAGHKSFEAAPRGEVARLARESEDHLREKLLTHYQGKPPTAVELWGVNFMETGPRRSMTLAVCMIVKNEADKVLLPINDMADFADECVVVDTGSTDETVKVLRERVYGGRRSGFSEAGERASVGSGRHPGLKLFHFPWNDDFAAARNYALAQCTADWVLWLDADDRVPEEAAKLIAANLRRPGPRTLNRRCYFRFQVQDLDAASKAARTFSQPRLFPNLPGITWESRLHESFVLSARRLGLEEIPTDITIQHTGYADPAALRAKFERNQRILEGDEPSPAKFWNLGNIHGMVGDWEEAVRCYDKVLKTEWREPLQAAFRDHVSYLACRALNNLGRFEDMAPYLEGNGHPDAFYMAGKLWQARGDRVKAIEHFRLHLDHTAKPIFWPWELDSPTLRPGSYACMTKLLADEFNDRQDAFRREHPDCFEPQEAAA